MKPQIIWIPCALLLGAGITIINPVVESGGSQSHSDACTFPCPLDINDYYEALLQACLDMIGDNDVLHAQNCVHLYTYGAALHHRNADDPRPKAPQ